MFLVLCYSDISIILAVEPMDGLNACRTGSILGGYSDGNTFWQHSMGVYDDTAQEICPASKGISIASPGYARVLEKLKS